MNRSRLVWLILLIVSTCTSCYYITPTDHLNRQLKLEAIAFLEKARTEMDEFVEDTTIHQTIIQYIESGYIPDDLYKSLKLKKFSTFLFWENDLIYWSDESFPMDLLNKIVTLEKQKGLFRDSDNYISFRKKPINELISLISLFEIETVIKQAIPRIKELGIQHFESSESDVLHSYDDLQFSVVESNVAKAKSIFYFILGICFWLGGLIGISRVITKFFNQGKKISGLLIWLAALNFFCAFYYFLIYPLWELVGLGNTLNIACWIVVLFLWNTILMVRVTREVKFGFTSLTSSYAFTFFTYFIIQLSFLLSAYYFKYLVFEASIPLDFENFFYFNPASIISLTNIILFSIAFFLIHFRLLNELPVLKIPVKNRLAIFAGAALLSTPLLVLSKLDIAIIPFLLVCSIYLILFELFIESKQKSITWVVTWLILFSGFSAIILFKYNWQKDLITRSELAHELYLSEGDFSPDYRIGIYQDQRLQATNAPDTYPKRLPPQYQNTLHDEVIEEGRSSLVYHRGDKHIIVGKKLMGMIKPISLFSYIFGLFLILAILFAIINTLLPFLPFQLNLKIANTKSLRTKIQLSVISVILASFIIIAIITVFYFKNSAEDNQVSQMRSKLSAIVQSVNIQAFHKDLEWIYSTDLRLEILNMSRINEANIQLFDLNGQLVYENPFKPTPNEFKWERLSVKTLGELKNGKSLLLEERARKTDRQLISYASITNKKQDILGFIAIPDMNLSSYIRKNVNEFIGTLLNVYIFLLLLAGSVAIAVANSITRPLVALGENLKRIKLGQRNEQLDWENQDEVGELINNYNEMINKLENSAQLLAMTERELAWREMARQIAHEIKNPLTPMKLSIQHMQHAIRSRPEEVDHIVGRVSSTLIEQIEALSQIASEFSNFANMPTPENEKIVLNEIVASAHDLFRKREDMDINLYVPIDEIYVFADKNHLCRVLNNLVKNAIQAIPKTRRGIINIKLYKEKDRAIIKVTDNGIGIPAEMKDKVFYPNFTTKSSGTGLGLAISANIIESFNGEIYFETKINEGTDFFVELPLMHMKDNFTVKNRVTL